MAYDEPNYTQTPNLFFDKHLPDMGHAEVKVVLAVIRETFGWHRKKQRMTNDDLMEATGLSKNSVISGVREAMDRGILAREEHHNSYRYWLVVGDEQRGEVGSPQGGDGGEVSEQEGEVSSQEGVKQVNPPSYNGETKVNKGEERKSSTSAEAADSSSDPPEDEDEDDPPPEEQVEYEWTLEYSRAAMQHLRDHDLLAPVTEKKIDREGEDAVAVAWADTFRLIHEQDGYSPDEIRQTMEWLFEGGNFWIDKAAIRSVPPLRSKTREGDQYKFDAMHAQAKREGHVRRNGDGSEHPWPENPSEEWCRNNPAKNFERLRHHAERA